MNPFIVADPAKCIGCRTCEVACVVSHQENQNCAAVTAKTFTSRIRVVKGGTFTTAVTCHQCEDAPCANVCPTQAIIAPHRLDARRCIAYLTIEHEGAIDPALRPLIGNRIFGCDDCQLVCPWNKFARRTDEPDFRARNALDTARLADLFAWDEDEFLQRTEGSPIRRSGHRRWLRNIAIALGNAPTTPGTIAALHSRRHSGDALVDEHIEWALAQHGMA